MTNSENNSENNRESNNNNQNSEVKEIIPYKILPDYIDLSHYNIKIENNKIIDIQSKDDNLNISYIAKLILEENTSNFKGLISNSTIRVFTNMCNKDIVNIIHIHLNDTSEEIAVDSLFLEKNDLETNYKHFNIDAQGKKLNYKFLFRDFKVI